MLTGYGLTRFFKNDKAGGWTEQVFQHLKKLVVRCRPGIQDSAIQMQDAAEQDCIFMNGKNYFPFKVF